jgi:hypothetical protein
MKFALSIALIISKLREPVPRCRSNPALMSFRTFSADQLKTVDVFVFGEEDVTGFGDVTIATYSYRQTFSMHWVTGPF